ncbi:acyl-CoA dehydrogenase family protein [Dermatobacter hominis]|uniref:acyl-CoA dehydrogenase family protein n=1 Tax=Dermatobacter hominis TaxID=2884263 RepID=UPI001D11152E|nr:acyl-CoA dehydrogenase family protein [Dermatobacter hominis]UDY35059.1 hypothetical protein LH044_17180 [Dermatobacter hominis]
MNPELPDEAVELGEVARRAFASLGGVDVARRAEADPDLRRTLVAPLLAELGVDDLDPRRDEVAAAAAAAVCEAAGRVALPYPLASSIVRDRSGRPTAAVPQRRWRVDHGDLFGEWSVGALDGPGGTGAPTAAVASARLGPFLTDLGPTGGEPAPPVDVLLHVVLTAWVVLGGLDAAVGSAVEHVNGREQFGRPLARFQAVQFQVADASVAVAGLRELAAFTLWRLVSVGSEARADVLALRLHALDVARPVLRICQQLHGAAGFCDEYDVSVLVRSLQPGLRLPTSAERTAELLADAIACDGFDGLFPHGRGGR